MRIRTLISFVFLVGCGGGGTAAKPDASVDAYFSNCGHPGDQGNELGIGKFCDSQASGECSTTMSAPLCSALGDNTTHFCTKTCTMGSTTQCGTATMCVCNGSNQCGCTPTVCLGP